MSAWIILLFFLCSNQSGCSCMQNNCMNDRGRDCGCNDDCGREGARDRDRDRDCNESRFEPRFEARPFADRETCGCEESNN